MRFERENNIVYMVMNQEDDDFDQGYELKMLEKNSIDGFLRCSLRRIDNKSRYYYDITSKQQFSRIYEFNKMTKPQVEKILTGIDAMVNSVNEYMLDLDSVTISPELIYVDMTTGRLFFTYGFRHVENGFKDGVKRLFDFIIERLDHNSDNRDILEIYGVYQKILQGNYDATELKGIINGDTGAEIKDNSRLAAERSMDYVDTYNSSDGNNTSCGDVLEFVPIEELEEEKEEYNHGLYIAIKVIQAVLVFIVVLCFVELLAPNIIPVYIDIRIIIAVMIAAAVVFGIMAKIPKNRLVNINKQVVEQPYIYSDSMICDNKRNSDNSINNRSAEDKAVHNYDSIADYGEHTMLLSDYIKSKGNGLRLISLQEDGQSININSYPWIIGTDMKHCNTVIDNKAISHLHACIIREDGRYYVEDMNSTNGTYYNGERLIVNSRQPIDHEGVITLAACSYKVEIS